MSARPLVTRRRMVRNPVVVLAALLLAAPGPVGGASPSPPAASPDGSCRTLLTGYQLLSLPIDRLERQVLVMVPPARRAGPMRLVLAFHGHSAHAGPFAATSDLSNAALQDGFVVAYPQGSGEPSDWHFPGGPREPEGSLGDLALVEALLDRLTDEGCVDTHAVFLVGHSKGGGMADAVACSMAERVAGVVLAAATQYGIPCDPSRPVPIVAFHAVNDRILPYDGGHIAGTPDSAPQQQPVEGAIARWAARNGCASGPATTRLPEGGAVLTWAGCQAPVVLHRLVRGGHAYPALATQALRSMVRGPVSEGTGATG